MRSDPSTQIPRLRDIPGRIPPPPISRPARTRRPIRGRAAQLMTVRRRLRQINKYYKWHKERRRRQSPILPLYVSPHSDISARRDAAGARRPICLWPLRLLLPSRAQQTVAHAAGTWPARLANRADWSRRPARRETRCTHFPSTSWRGVLVGPHIAPHIKAPGNTWAFVRHLSAAPVPAKHCVRFTPAGGLTSVHRQF